MIKVIVDKPIKLSGLVSCKLFFSYNNEILNYLKSLPGPCVFNKVDSSWEVPIYHLAEVLDTLVYYDDINLQICENPEVTFQNQPPLTQEEIDSFKVPPYPHQIEGINYLLAKGKALLLDAPGLGKSMQLIYYAEVLKKRGLIDHCLIVAGINSLKSNWRREIQKVSNETCVIIGEKRKKNGEISPIPALVKIEQTNLRTRFQSSL